MENYDDKDYAKKIENWRNRLTHSHDVNKIRTNYSNYRQAKAVVDYAKRYIVPLI